MNPMLPAPASPFDYSKLSASDASSLRAVAENIRRHKRDAIASIIGIGEALIAVKRDLEHGQFSAWVEAECGFTLRSAENYIRAAEFAEGKNETVALLPPAAVYKLAAKSTPPALVQEIMERVESGTAVTAAEIDAALAEARHQKRDAERKAREAERRQKRSKRALAQEEGRRRAEEKRRQQEDEKLRLQAVSLIDAIGEDHARLVVEALCGMQGWQVADHLRREMSERESARVKSETRVRGNGRDDAMPDDAGRWIES